MSRSLTAHQSAEVSGWTVSPEQLRMPAAKMRMAPPSGLNASTSARFSLAPQAGPVGGTAGNEAIPAGGAFGIDSATFEPEPTETYMVLPSGEKTISRVQWPPP